MPGFFTDPHDEELVYSATARFQQRAEYPNERDVVRELYGNGSSTAVIDLPGNLEHLVASLPPGHAYTVDTLIDSHTLFPIFAPFWPPERAQHIRRDMHANRGPSIHTRGGIMASRIPRPPYLQSCPCCAEEDISLVGEPYWHRVAQVPGVLVCPKHAVWLERSLDLIRREGKPYHFVTASSIITPVNPAPLDLSDPSQQTLLAIARGSAWLLHQPGLRAGPAALRARYLDVLADQNLATYHGRLRGARLLEAFRMRYPASLLAAIHCELDDTINENWLFRTIRSRKESMAPVQHLLIMDFLGYTAQGFFTRKVAGAPFGDGPWPCLNRTCPHYQKAVIRTCAVGYDQTDGRPIGTFRCQCGFTYSRRGPDSGSADCTHRGKIVAFGSRWCEELTRLSNVPGISLRETARRLGVDPATVKYQLDKLDQLKDMSPNAEQVTGQEGVHGPKALSLDDCKTLWLEAKQEHPTAGSKQLRALHPDIYMQLYRHDRVWLLANRPPSQRNAKVPVSRVNWTERDQTLADQVPAAALSIKDEPGRFQQVTVAAIGRRVGEAALLQRHLDKLPRTARALAEHVENREQFAFRRIQRIADGFIERGHRAHRWEIIKAAGVDRLVSSPEVLRALNAALDRINVALS